MDERECDGNPLRKCINVSFLNSGKADGKKSFIYQSQTSCLVTGVDHWVWDAYGFVDTYYESEENRKNAEYYEDLEGLPAGERPDLLPAGDHLTPIWTPREYFLMVFESRMTLQVVPEWKDIVERLEEGVVSYVRGIRESGGQCGGGGCYSCRVLHIGAVDGWIHFRIATDFRKCHGLEACCILAAL